VLWAFRSTQFLVICCAPRPGRASEGRVDSPRAALSRTRCAGSGDASGEDRLLAAQNPLYEGPCWLGQSCRGDETLQFWRHLRAAFAATSVRRVSCRAGRRSNAREPQSLFVCPHAFLFFFGDVFLHLIPGRILWTTFQNSSGREFRSRCPQEGGGDMSLSREPLDPLDHDEHIGATVYF
jgi:hypothetical protein